MRKNDNKGLFFLGESTFMCLMHVGSAILDLYILEALGASLGVIGLLDKLHPGKFLRICGFRATRLPAMKVNLCRALGSVIQSILY